MKRGYKIAIVALVAIATNFALHASFGWGNHCRNYNHQGYMPQGGCGHHQHCGEYPGNNSHSCGNAHYNQTPNASSNNPVDTLINK